MQKADSRMNQLKDLLHHAGMPPMTGTIADDPTGVLKPRLQGKKVHLVAETSAFSLMLDHTQFRASVGDVVRKTMLAKIKTADNLTWVPPLRKAQQIKITILNRNADKKSNKRLVDRTLRAKDNWMGKERRADVKVVLNGTDGRPHIYFAR
jgi:hypothetical protein